MENISVYEISVNFTQSRDKSDRLFPARVLSSTINLGILIKILLKEDARVYEP
jgi:hypothetical protein